MKKLISRAYSPYFIVLAVLLLILDTGAEGVEGGGNTVGLAQRSPVLLPGPGGKELIGETIGEFGGEPANGRPIYEKYCVYCHGKTGLGDGMAAVGLKPSPADLSQSFLLWEELEMEDYKRLEQKLFDIITYGSKGSDELHMPAWGPVLSRGERLDVLAYIKMMLTEKDEEQ